MIKVRLITTANQEMINVPEDMTVREILEDNDITVLNNAIVMLDGCNLRPGDMAKTLQELDVTDDACVLSVVIKTANAAIANVCGPCVTIVSSVKLENLKTIAKHRPKALNLYEEHDGEVENVFSVAVSRKVDSTGSLNKHGATFCNTPSAEGCATIVMSFDNLEEMKDEIGLGLLRLSTLEAGLPAVLTEIEDEKIEIDGMIHIN